MFKYLIVFCLLIFKTMGNEFTYCDSNIKNTKYTKYTKYMGMINLHNYVEKSCEVCLSNKLVKNKITCVTQGIAKCIVPMINVTYGNNEECIADSNIVTVFTNMKFTISLTKKSFPIGYYMEICVGDKKDFCSFSLDQ